MKEKRSAQGLDKKKNTFVKALVANRGGEIFELKGYAAAGMAGPILSPLTMKDTLPMPFGSELMLMPDRRPILYNMDKHRCETLLENPYAPGEPIFPVAAFNSPGHLVTYVSAYKENENAGVLPLFSYGAVGWLKGKFRSAVIRVDKERRQDLRLMKHEDIVEGIQKMRQTLPDNRLREHLEKCALEYGCPAGKNFFLGRYEAPLPTSPHCNARCLGCLSLQENDQIPHSQDRIAFQPSPNEVAEVAMEHIKRVNRSIVSFGQGCEGDPLLVADVILSAIVEIRSHTARGTINMNTNGSRPDVVEKLFYSGLDSVRISLNSVREAHYRAYFRPKGFGLSEVKKSIKVALNKGKFVAINYLSCPGFTDTPEEVEALMNFIKEYPIQMVQWRNLNFDPGKYLKTMNDVGEHGTPIGIRRLLDRIRSSFPDLKFGYFNPPKESFLK